MLMNTEFLFLLWWGIGLQYRGFFSGFPEVFTVYQVIESEQRFVQQSQVLLLGREGLQPFLLKS